MQREQILKALKAQINVNGHIIGAVAGAGMTAKYAVMGGADFLLALSAGKYRIMGRSSFASYFCHGNSNDIVMQMGMHELLPIISKVPILFGIFASDPFIHLYEYLKEIKSQGFGGVVNFPTLALIDGRFRKALEDEGNTYDQEVEAIKLAHYLELFTVAFVTDEEQTQKMLNAGADVICVHLGLTKGGFLGAKKYISLDQAKKAADSIFAVCDAINPGVIKMIYAGPANTPIDMQYMYQNTKCQGYIGGSTFDRIPTERAILNTTKAFKSYGGFDGNDPMAKLINGNWNTNDYADFVKKYIEEHYMKEIQLADLALVAHISPSYLSIRFKKEMGCNFTEYLIRFRMNKAKEFLQTGKISCKEAAERVGYYDYAQFSKMFKKYLGQSPSYFRTDNINT
ncbi:helix-turn-helix domain-containing protein [Clostridiales bacterium COT073_COT-073]|nr:helix-turn-helix domain-containing protein [Clostridiales bacterium COT073_COT-073]